MELTIENYYNKIPNKETITTRELLIYLAYFLENNLQPVSAANLKNCCLNLKIRPYSNIPAWLSDNSKGKNAILIKEKPGCYKLERKMYVKINEFITGEKNRFVGFKNRFTTSDTGAWIDYRILTKQNTVWIPQSTRYFYIKHTSELLPNISNSSSPQDVQRCLL